MEKLNETYSKNPFKIPDNYFDEVNRKIIAATSGNNSEAKKVSLYVRIKPYLAIAAFISGVVLITYTALQLFRPNDMENIKPEISLQEFSESYLDDIDINLLEENSEAFLLTEEYQNISTPEIIDYLLLENIDVNEIYELF
jgi:hypothetical protein